MKPAQWRQLKLVVEMPARDLDERDFRWCVETLLRENLSAFLRRHRSRCTSGRIEVKQLSLVRAAEKRRSAITAKLESAQ